MEQWGGWVELCALPGHSANVERAQSAGSTQKMEMSHEDQNSLVPKHVMERKGNILRMHAIGPFRVPGSRKYSKQAHCSAGRGVNDGGTIKPPSLVIILRNPMTRWMTLGISLGHWNRSQRLLKTQGFCFVWFTTVTWLNNTVEEETCWLSSLTQFPNLQPEAI